MRERRPHHVLDTADIEEHLLKRKASIGIIPRGVSYLTSTFDRKDLFHNPDRQNLLDLRETASAGYGRTYGISRLRQWISPKFQKLSLKVQHQAQVLSLKMRPPPLSATSQAQVQIPSWPRCWRIRTTQRQRRQESVLDWVNSQKITLTCGGYTIPEMEDVIKDRRFSLLPPRERMQVPLDSGREDLGSVWKYSSCWRCCLNYSSVVSVRMKSRFSTLLLKVVWHRR